VQVIDGARWRPDIARTDIRVVEAKPLPTVGN
jgi:hypothetical protein